MLNFFKKTTTDLVKEWNIIYTNEVLKNPKLSEKNRKDIVDYVAKNKNELSVVLNSLVETARLKNGDKITKDLFNEILNWIHSLIWTAITSGIVSGANFRKSYDYVFEAYKLTVTNPEEALDKYKKIVGED